MVVNKLTKYIKPALWSKCTENSVFVWTYV